MRISKHEIRRLLLSTLGLMILGLSINLLSWQFRLISGGLPGYALVTNYLTNFPVGLFLIISNTLILLTSLIIAGKTAGIRGIYGYVFLSIFIELSKNFLKLHQIIIPSFLMNTFLVILQRITAPIGISLVIVSDYSFGSYSSMLPIVNKFKRVSPPLFFFVCDCLLTVITLLFFGFSKALLLFINAFVFFMVFHFTLKKLQKYKSKFGIAE